MTKDYIKRQFSNFYNEVIKGNYAKSEDIPIADNNTLAENNGVISLAPFMWNKEIDETPNEAGIIRKYFPFAFISGKTYEIQFEISKMTPNPNSTTVFNVRSTNDTTIVDQISGEINQTVYQRGVYVYKYTPSQNCNSLYIYLNSDAAPINISIAIYSDTIKTINTMVGNVGSVNYEGQKINLHQYSYNLLKEGGFRSDISKAVQGIAISNDKLFRLYDSGICKVFDYATKEINAISTFNLGSYSETGNHANSCNFSNIYYDSADIYPLLYVTDGNSAEVMRCAVERITNDLSGSTKVQTITLDQSGFSAKNLETYWGWSTWLIAEDGLYYFGAKYRTNGSQRENDSNNKYIITKFDIPSLTDTDVTLTADDVKEQWTSTYDTEFTQGGCIYGDYLFFCFGNPAQAPSVIKVFSLSQKSAIARIDLSNSLIKDIELEDLAVYNNKLIVGLASWDIYSIEFM